MREHNFCLLVSDADRKLFITGNSCDCHLNQVHLSSDNGWTRTGFGPAEYKYNKGNRSQPITPMRRTKCYFLNQCYVQKT